MAGLGHALSDRDVERLLLKEGLAMDIKPIRTDLDYKAALKDITRLMEKDPEMGTADGDRLDILSTLVHAYEQRQFPMDLPDPVEAIKSAWTSKA